MKSSKYLLVVLMSITLIGLELVWTRIFSAEFFYTFAFLTLSLSILGLGLGALAVHLFPALDKERNLGFYLSLSALLALAGPALIFKIGLDFTSLFGSWLMVGKFLLTIFLLSATYFFAGISLTIIFKRNHREMPKIYMADLLGAGLGVVLAVLLMNGFGTPVTTFLIVFPLILGAFLYSLNWLKLLPAGLLAVMILMSYFAPSLLEAQRKERATVIYKHWDALSKIKIYEFSDEYYGLNIDNAANSPVYHFDGNWDRPDSMRYQFGIDVSYLINQFESCTFLSLGAGGGVDVLQALQEGAGEVHAVEVNPHINYLMTEGQLAEFSGNIYHDSRVIVASEDARAYVRRFENKFDMIFSLSSNSFAALASGSFALAENYLFTREAFEDYWNSLSADGFMMMEHQFYVPRLVSELMEALQNQGVTDVKSHFAVYNLPQMRRKMLLISKRPLNDEIRNNAFGSLSPEKHKAIHLLFPAADSLKGNLINQIVENGWQQASEKATIDLSPCDDNRPFAAQLGLWKNLDWNKLDKVLPYEFFGFPLSEIIISIILLVVICLIIPINLLPYLLKSKKLKMVPWLYFFAIGMAFMIVEVVFIQKYALFIGPSVYSFSTILLSLLIASGIGSRFAGTINDRIAFLGIVGWLLLEIFLFPHLTGALGFLEMPYRIMISILLIFPLGFFMGMPFPKGTLRVGELIDWGFAVNGAASVLGATLIVLISINYGFNMALLLGLFLYMFAYLMMTNKKAW